MDFHRLPHPEKAIRRALRVGRMTHGPVAGVLIEQAMH